MNLLAHFGNRVPCGDSEDLRVGETGRRLNQRGDARGGCQGHEKIGPAVADDLVDEDFDVAGRTSAASRPITIGAKPNARRCRRSQMISRASRHTTPRSVACSFTVTYTSARASAGAGVFTAAWPFGPIGPLAH